MPLKKKINTEKQMNLIKLKSLLKTEYKRLNTIMNIVDKIPSDNDYLSVTATGLELASETMLKARDLCMSLK